MPRLYGRWLNPMGPNAADLAQSLAQRPVAGPMVLGTSNGPDRPVIPALSNRIVTTPPIRSDGLPLDWRRLAQRQALPLPT